MAKRFPASGLSSYFTASGTALARATNVPKRTKGIQGGLVRHVSAQQPSLQMFVLDGWGLGDGRMVRAKGATCQTTSLLV